jgi:UDP-N-acetylenolpyruvoylglucosamine reductase
MRVGGQAEWLLEPRTPDELHHALVEAHERGLPVRMLGAGADLIVEDGLHPGVVVSTGLIQRVFRPEPEARGDAALGEAAAESAGRVAPTERERDPRLVAWCGASLPGLVRTAAELGWSGLEGLVGMPGKVGGAVATNAGGRWGEIWDRIETVRVLTPAGEVRDLDRSECSPVYRDGRLGDLVVVGVLLQLEVSSSARVKETTRQYLLQKNAVQPVTEACAGCIFKNPDRELSEGRSAGQLIDHAGLKGRERGAAIVSPLHGNFIVNRGGARAADVLGLIEEVREEVHAFSGVRLECEVRIWRREAE